VLHPYRLARDYAQTLIAHAVAKRIPQANAMLPAVHENLDQSTGFEEWSFA
jgi:ABC-type thiamine transport system substrate-binding protein